MLCTDARARGWWTERQDSSDPRPPESRFDEAGLLPGLMNQVHVQSPPRQSAGQYGQVATCSRKHFGGAVVGKGDDIFRRQARVLKALANESRLRIVDRLSRGECSVGELTDLVGLDRSTISKHLAVLRAHGIVLDRREGNVVYYTLLIPCVMNFFSCASQVLKERA